MAPRREIFAWAMFDFANSGYTTVVLTAVFNAYFVSTIAASHGAAMATLLWTIAMAVSNALVLLSAPVLGAMADYRADKKRFLAVTTLGCIVATAALALVRPDDLVLAMGLLILSNAMFATGEGLIAAFLPELVPADHMGRVSGLGWTLGYVGGLLVLGVCLVYVTWAQQQGLPATQFVPVTLWITATAFALASLPTFLWMKERAQAKPLPEGEHYIVLGFRRVVETLGHVRHYQDLFRFLITLTVFYSGIYTVILLAAIYAQQVMGFTTRDTLILILVVNVTAAIGAFGFGIIQDRIGSISTLMATLLLWVAALLWVYATSGLIHFWIAANMIGLALGSSQSAGRALVGLFSPIARVGEFFGLWNLASRLAAIIGPLSYGAVIYVSGGNQKLALLSTTVYFLIGIVLLSRVNEQRGRKIAALQAEF